MAQGLGAGILWGAVAGTALVAGFAQVAPMVTVAVDPVVTEAPARTPVVDAPDTTAAPAAEVAVPEATAPVAAPTTTESPAPAPTPAEGTAASPVADAPPAPPAPASDAPGDTAPDVATETPPAPGAPETVPVPSTPAGPSGAPPASSTQAAPAAPGSESAPAAREAAPSAPATTQDLAVPDPGDAARPARPEVPAPAADQTATAIPVAPAIPAEPRQDAPVADVAPLPEQPAANPPEAAAALETPAEPQTATVQDTPAPAASLPAAIAEAVPETAPDATAGPAAEVSPEPGQPSGTVRVGRLPRIGDEAAPEVGTDSSDDPVSPPVAALPGMPGRALPTQPTPAAPAPEALPAEDAGALAAFAVPFENPENGPVLAIVLVDTGAAARPAAEAMANFPFPLTVALDPTSPDAAETMQAYRAAGVEIAAFVRFPDDATAQDVAVAWDVHRTTLAESVALVDASDGAIQSRREPMAQVVAELARSGHGFVTVSQGFNAGQKLAEREGIPSALVFRSLDPSDRGAMSRALDQGAFRAGQDGRAVLTAPLSAETLAVLAEWGLGTRQAVVSLSPLSAALD